MHSFSLYYVNAFKEVNQLGDKWRPFNYRVQLEVIVISRQFYWSLIRQRLCLIAICSMPTKPLVEAAVTGNQRNFQDLN